MIDYTKKNLFSSKFCNFQSTKMVYGVFECKWYDLPPKDAKDLMFIVYRSTIPLRLTAGKFGIFSVQMFGMVRYIYEKKHIAFSVCCHYIVCS